MDAFTAFCVDLLSPLGAVRSRAMFGGQGLYVDGLFCALIANGELFLKADDATRPQFIAAGCTPFSYKTKEGESMTMSYLRPPEEAMESPPLMLPWARLALEAALRAANAKTQTKAKKASAKPKAPAKKAAAR
jgi:DNA transformation protein and related proteins